MDKFLIFALFCFVAHACEPTDPALIFVGFNDADGDGTLSRQEWRASKIPPELRASFDAGSDSAFEALDADRDGKISLKEFGLKPLYRVGYVKNPCDDVLFEDENRSNAASK